MMTPAPLLITFLGILTFQATAFAQATSETVEENRSDSTCDATLYVNQPAPSAGLRAHRRNGLRVERASALRAPPRWSLHR